MLKDHNAVMPVRLEPTASRSRVKHSTTEPLRSLKTKNTRPDFNLDWLQSETLIDMLEKEYSYFIILLAM